MICFSLTFLSRHLLPATVAPHYGRYLGVFALWLVFSGQALAQGAGGNVTYSGPYTIHTFTSNGSFTVNATTAVDLIVVAGGGGGGHQHAGGGGAGGVVGYYIPSVTPGSYPVFVGDGGAGCSWYPYTGGNGGTSNALGVNTDGGGGGTGMPQYGNNGGSGGGDGYPSGGIQGGYETVGMGNSGSRGNSLSTFNGGGGGGAGSPGSGLLGGAPVTTWAGTFGGGGGGGYGGGAGGGAGAGNGGGGAAYGGHAAPNTGSGGGGGGNMDAYGGNGGSGIVVIRYLTQAPPTDSGFFVSQSVPATVNPGQVFTFTQTWTNNGTATWSAAGNYHVCSANPYDNLTWGTNRFGTTGTVVAGTTATITCTATAPAYPGTYTFQTGLVHDGVARFAGTSTNLNITVVNRPPTNTTSILNSAKTILATNPTASVNLGYGDSFYVRVAGTDPDGLLYILYLRMNKISGVEAWDYPGVSVSGASASYDFGPYNTANGGGIGIVNVWTHTQDAWSGGYTWQGNGWWGSDEPDVNIVKATPNLGLVNRTFTGTKTMTATELPTVAASPYPYDSSVILPSGTVTYSVSGTTGGSSPSSGAVGVGTIFHPGTYTVTATYAGDLRYNAVSTTATWTITNAAPAVTLKINGTSANVSASFGQAVTLSSTLTDPDANSAVHDIWWDKGNGSFWTNTSQPWDTHLPDATGWTNFVGSHWSVPWISSNTFSATFTAQSVGTFTFLGTGYDQTGTWATSSGQYALAVSKNTPALAVNTFLGGNRNSLNGTTYTVVGSDLNAVFVNSFGTGVAAPTGLVTYSRVDTGTAVAIGTVLTGSTSYVIRASYPGNSNYNAVTKDVTWSIVLDPNGDIDSDGMSNGFEQTNFGSATAGDPNADPDNDGFTNIAEYNLGKNPTVYDAGTSTEGNATTPVWPNTASGSPYAVGTTAGELTVDKSGALTYAIPIWTTPGTAGMEPKLSLNYSSQAGNGIAGLGWSISGTSAITRGGRTKAIDTVNQGVTFTASDRFYLDGQRLILVSGTYGAANSEYRTELDSFTKVIAYGNRGTGPAYFKAWTKAGLIIEFGNTADSAFDAWGRTEAFNWSVNKISDTVGNYMNYSYEEDAANGVHRLTQIDYTGNGSIPTYASLRFAYEARTDTFFGYSAGSPISALKRLKTIKSYYGETIARTYTLNYTERAAAATRSLLTSVTETGSDGTSYPALTFDYETPTGGWAAANYSSAPNYPSLSPPHLIAQKDVVTGTGLMDLNGDGYPDFVRKKMSNAGEVYNDAYLNTVAGWTSSTAMRLPGSGATLAWDGKQDSGGRLLDVNGDGLVDALLSLSTVSYATHNYGTGWDYNIISPTPAGFTFALDTTKADSGRRIVDINGDGLPDILWNTGVLDNGCLINNSNGQYLPGGAAWVSASQWIPPFTIMENVSSGSQFFDVNGDGLPDLVQMGFHSSIEAGIALNSPTGWGAQNTTWNRVTANLNSTYASVQSALGAALGKYLPPAFLSKDTTGWLVSPIGSEIVDLNGDGLPDILFSNPKLGTNINASLRTPGAWLNTGNGWVAASQYTPPVALIGRTDGGETDSTGAVLADLNGDGLADLAMYRAGQSSLYYLNTGHGWGTQNTPYQSGLDFALPVAVTNSDVTIPTGFQLVDLNADGITDIIANSTYRYNLTKPSADKLIKVTNGLGVAASAYYALLTERDATGNPTVYTKGAGATYPVVDITGPMLVVKTVNNDDGVGGQYPVNYKYAGLRSDALRGSLGFGYMEVTDGRTSIRSQTTFAQTYPFIGMPLQSKTISGATTLSQTDIVYGDKLLNGGLTHFVFAANSLALTNDLDGSPTSTVNTTVSASDIDAYGNIATITVNADDFVKTTTSTYTNDLANWFLGRLMTSSVESRDPSLATVTRTAAFTYNSTTGLLLTETVQPGTSTYALTTTYGYDAFGNKNSVEVRGKSLTVDNNGIYTVGGDVFRTTTTQYDFHGRNPIWTRNAASHQEDYYVYDEALGVLKHMGGANGLPTTWSYDGFGRKTQENRADGTYTATHYRWVSGAPMQAKYYGTGTTPVAKYHVETTSPGSPSSLAFYDAFGRAFLNLGINGDGQIVYQTTQYDAQGRAFATSTPYFDGGTVAWARTTSYDLLNRPLTNVTPDDEAPGDQVNTSSTYSGLQATATDPKGRVSRTIKNSQGWTTQNTRNETAMDGAPASTVTYEYDAIGNLKKTTAAGVITTVVYDPRGRKEQMVDADMGTWNYRYNIFGELIWQKDAKGQITTMTYDALGRLTGRVEAEGTTSWNYDSTSAGGAWKGKLYQVTAPGAYSETYLYDSYGRPGTVTRTIDGTAYATSLTYDSVGRPLRTIYPATGIGSGAVSTRNVYNDYGYLKEIRNYLASDDGKLNHQLQGLLYWQADRYSVTGRIDGETYGNGLSNDRYYSKVTGRLLQATIDRGVVITGPFFVQDLRYSYDAMGNVRSRIDYTQNFNRDERFSYANGSDGYDGLDRLKVHRVVGGATVTIIYDQQGNITDKSDVGAYLYNYTPAGRTNVLPHAVSSANGVLYTYDANGNMKDGANRTLLWTSFNQMKKVTDTATNKSSEFFFGAGHERVKQVRKTGSTVTDTTIYVGGLFEKVTTGTLVEFKHYLAAPSGRIAVVTQSTVSGVIQANTTRYFHTDGLGSITVVSDERGRVLKRYAYDAWGKQSTRYTNTSSGIVNQAPTTRGFTDHEMLSDFSLIHMNGRVYDPTLGRFLSADPNVDGVSDAQGFNRYSYVGNNPMNATDPSGYFKLKEVLGAIIAIVVTAIAIVVLGPSGIYAAQGFFAALQAGLTASYAIGAAAIGGFAGGFSGSLLNGGSLGDAFKAGVLGAAVGAATAWASQAIGGFFGPDDGTFAQWGERTLAHATVGGLASEAQGGSFRHGFYSSAASNGIMHVKGVRSFMGGDKGGAWIAARTAAAAAIGGTTSVLGGGKFANGAATSAFQHLFNAEATKHQPKGVAVVFLNNENDPDGSMRGSAPNDLHDLIKELQTDLEAKEIITKNSGGLAYYSASNYKQLMNILGDIKAADYDIILVSHGTTGSDYQASVFGRKLIPIADFIKEVNRDMGASVLSLDTRWDRCTYTYGRVTVEKVFYDMGLKADITGRLMNINK